MGHKVTLISTVGFANGFAKDLGLDASGDTQRMTSGNYTNLVKVFDSYFGDYVDLVTTNPDLLAGFRSWRLYDLQRRL